MKHANGAPGKSDAASGPNVGKARDARDARAAKKGALSSGKVSALLVGVDDEIEQMRQRMSKILSDEPSPDVPTHSAHALEGLFASLREANAHLVIASLDATSRQSKAELAHARQTLFLSMLAHELRNPLAPISMAVELLGKLVEVHPTIRTLQEILARQTLHLTRLVDDLMDATRINSGKIKIHKNALALSQVLQTAVETTQPLIDARQQSIVMELQAGETWVNGDLVRLTQLFSNLLINASKFSADHTAIRLVAQRAGGAVTVSVIDRGMGIAPALQPHVFDLFAQGPPGQGPTPGGLGIGLSLARTIAQLHGGTVSVQSAGVGQGSVFTVRLPLLAGASLAAPEPPAQPPVVTSKQVLLIDDNPDINTTLSDFLLQAGHDTGCALDGPSALQMESLRHYDIICCDIGLPGMDGYEVAWRLRHGAAPAGTCLIAISGYDSPEFRARALKVGFNHYLVKPIFGPELLELIERQPRMLKTPVAQPVG